VTGTIPGVTFAAGRSGKTADMTNKICAMGVSLVVAGGALTISGCGSSSSPSAHDDAAPTAVSHTTTTPAGQALVEAADQVDQVSGYRIAATVQVDTGSASISMTMQGVTEHGGLSALSMNEAVGGQKLNLRVVADHEIYYMTGVPGLSKLSHGKPWVSYNLAATQQAMGLGGLQSSASSNPAQFLTYLRTVGSKVQTVGTTTIGGDATTEYQADLDLDRYARLVPAAQQAAARTSIARLETELGAHQLPVTAWVDAQHQVRRMHLQIPVCVAGRHLSMSMTMNMSDYGNVPSVAVPSAAETADITPLLKSELSSAKHQASQGCSAG
jgi:hypothetical protein